MGVAAHQPGLVRTHAPRDAIPFEQQTGTDHVHGADDDRRRRRIFQPLTVVDVLAPEGRDRQRPAGESQLAPDMIERRTQQPLTNRLGNIGGLIDYRATVDDVDEPAGQRRSGSARQ